MSSGPSPSADAQLLPLQSALAAEHAAVYGYEVVGGVLGASDQLATTSYEAHRGRRDQLLARLGADAVAAEAAYSLPFQVGNEKQARRLARLLEQRCAAAYADVVSRTSGEVRLLAARALSECAVRGLSWGAEPEPFPGLT